MRCNLTISILALGLFALGCGDESSVAGTGTTEETSDAGVDPFDASSSDGDDVSSGPIGKDGWSGIDVLAEGGETPDLASCEEGEPCDDGNPCTQEDLCMNEVCVGTPLDCDDGLGCTVDTCGQDGGCQHAIEPSSCLIEGVCFESQTAHPELPCLSCQPASDYTNWSHDDALNCDDGDPCTQGDRCLLGACAPTGLTTCEDSNPCTVDSCELGVGCVFTSVEASCDDGDSCSLADTCIDGVCTAGEVGLDCSDGNVCTEDSCEDGACVFTPGTGACEDGNPCTANDSCQEGNCVPGGQTDLGCEDSNPCTDSGCDPILGCIYIANENTCDDGDPCTLNDSCGSTQCQSGAGELACDDGNTCTTDACQKDVGCIAINNFDSCDDDDECTTTDLCNGGSCVGQAPLECIDGNLCTDDACDPQAGCVFENNSESCDDGSLCTFDDSCAGGGCTGTPVECDDENVCTSDACDGVTGGCLFEPVLSDACVPTLNINTPVRGEGVKVPVGQTVVVEGVFGTPAGELSVLTLQHLTGQGIVQTVDLMNSGGVDNDTFTGSVVPVHGLNHVTVSLVDSIGGSLTRTHSFFYSTEWLSPDSSSLVDEGLIILLGPDVIDDGDRSLPANDLGTVFELVAQEIDLAATLANGQKLTTTNVPVIGDVDIYATGMSYSGPFVFLDSFDGYLEATIILQNLKVDLSFVYETCFPFVGCSDSTLTGNATASEITIVTKVAMSLNPATGELEASSLGTDVIVGSNFDVNLDGILGAIVEFIVGFFNDTFANELASAVEGEVEGLIPSLFGDAFSSLEISEVFSFPPLFGGDQSVDVVFESFLALLDFFSEGALIGMESTANPLQPLPKDTLGSIGRAECLETGSDISPFFTGDDLGIGLHDDVFNRLLFAVWQGGGLEFPVSSDALGGLDLDGLGIGDLSVEIEFLAPPVVSGCTPSGDLEIQIGDMGVYASLTFGAIPLDVDIYASLRAEAAFTVVEDDGGQQLGLTLSEVKDLKTDLVFSSPEQMVFEDALVTLIEEELIPIFLGTLTEGSIGGFPLPSIDLSSIEGIPGGVELELDLNSVQRVGGYSMLLGGVK